MIPLTPEEICKLSSMSSHIKPRKRNFEIKSREKVKSFMKKSKKGKSKTKHDKNKAAKKVEKIFGEVDEEEELEQ